jgi:transcriptional regulator with XRE-family HTH domain
MLLYFKEVGVSLEENIGHLIRELRKKHNHSLKYLGEKVNFNYSNLSKVERGERKPSTELLESLSKLYEVPINYFFKDGFTKEDLEHYNFKKSEQELFFEKDLSLDNIKENYNLIIDDKPATDEEIEKMLEYIRFLRHQNRSS